MEPPAIRRQALVRQAQSPWEVSVRHRSCSVSRAYLQIRLFYTHKGTEKLFEHLPVSHGVFLAESISGDSSFSHGVAFCQAIERAAEIEVPQRAQVIRTVLLELERLYNHVGDIGAIATDVGFVIANMHAGRLREMLLAINEHLTGNRLLRGMVAVGGVRRDWSPIPGVPHVHGILLAVGRLQQKPHRYAVAR